MYNFNCRFSTWYIPDTFFWSLTDSDGKIINGLHNIEITELYEVNAIFLYDDDLKTVTGTGSDRLRKIVVHVTYTSVLGVGLPVKNEFIFYLKDLTAVT